jgi:hypothetical protein
MYIHFQQDFLIIQEFTTVFFDPEPTGDTVYYHLKFDIGGNQQYLVMTRNEEGDWEMVDKEEHGRFQDYELQFGYAIKHRNLISDNL